MITFIAMTRNNKISIYAGLIVIVYVLLSFWLMNSFNSEPRGIDYLAIPVFYALYYGFSLGMGGVGAVLLLVLEVITLWLLIRWSFLKIGNIWFNKK